MREFWRRNQVNLLYTPLIIAMALMAYIVLHALDPRIGVEGLGDYMGYILNAGRLAMIVGMVWWFKKWAWFDLHEATELELFEASRKGDKAAENVLRRDRLEWAFLLVLVTWAMTR